MKKVFFTVLSALAASTLTAIPYLSVLQQPVLASYSCIPYSDQGSLGVNAREDMGSRFGASCFRNDGRSGTFTFRANGSWTYDPGRGNFTPNGDVRRACRNNCVIDSEPVGGLVAVVVRNTGRRDRYYIGQGSNLYLSNGDSVLFMNNDTWGAYSDN